MGPGVIGSLALHGALAAIIIFGLPHLLRDTAEAPSAIPIDLVRLGDRTRAPAALDEAQAPQEMSPETRAYASPQAVPVPQTQPPLQSSARRPEDGSVLDVLASPNSDAPAQPKPVEGPRPNLKAAGPPQPQPAPPTDALQAKLQALARLRQPTAPAPPSPQLQAGAGLSNRVAGSDAASGPDATYAVKDFLRAQIERRWHPDQGALARGAGLVSIHLQLNRDGTVVRAEIVDNPRLATDQDFRALALSARNAALLSSPLNLPPGSYDLVKDITLDFDPRAVSR